MTCSLPLSLGRSTGQFRSSTSLISYASQALATAGSMAPVLRSQSLRGRPAWSMRAEDRLERAELASPADDVVHPGEIVVKERWHARPSGRSAGVFPHGRGTCFRRVRRCRSAESRGNRPGPGWSTRFRRRSRDRPPGARGCSSRPRNGRSAAGREDRRSRDSVCSI